MKRTGKTAIPFLRRISPGPYTAEPLQWDHGASIAICCRDDKNSGAYIIAVIEPENAEDEPDFETAKRGPCDVANSMLLAASYSMYVALLEIANANETEDIDRRLASIRVAKTIISNLEAQEGKSV